MTLGSGAHTLSGLAHMFHGDRFCLLGNVWPARAGPRRGRAFVVFDGIESAPQGRGAARLMCDRIHAFFRRRDIQSEVEELHALVCEATTGIRSWDSVAGPDQSAGGCAGPFGWHRAFSPAFMLATRQACFWVPSATRGLLRRTRRGTWCSGTLTLGLPSSSGPLAIPGSIEELYLTGCGTPRLGAVRVL